MSILQTSSPKAPFSPLRYASTDSVLPTHCVTVCTPLFDAVRVHRFSRYEEPHSHQRTIWRSFIDSLIRTITHFNTIPQHAWLP